MKLRNAEPKDSNWIFKLSNSVRQFSLNKKLITRKEHKKWYKENYHKIKVIGNNIGTIRKDEHDFISISIKEQYRNKGIGTEVLMGFKGKAIILTDNENSLKAFEKAGFHIKGYYLEK